MLLGGGIGADQGAAPVGILGARGPDLLAVNLPVIAHVDAAHLQGGQVGPGARLGIADAPANLAAADGRDVLLLLLFGAVIHDGRTDHGHAHAGHQRVEGADGGHFLLQDPGLGLGETAAAILGRPGGGAPTLGAHGGLPLAHIAGGGGAVHQGQGQTLLAAQALREVGFQPVAGFLAEGFQFNVAAKIRHVGLSGRLEWVVGRYNRARGQGYKPDARLA